jgi:hypothetical protein
MPMSAAPRPFGSTFVAAWTWMWDQRVPGRMRTSAWGSVFHQCA